MRKMNEVGKKLKYTDDLRGILPEKKNNKSLTKVGKRLTLTDGKRTTDEEMVIKYRKW